MAFKYGGIFILVGILLILISGIVPTLFKYFDDFSKGLNLVNEFFLAIIGNYLFWVGFVISLVGFAFRPKSLFLISEARDLIEKKYTEEKSSFMRNFKIYRLISSVFKAMALILSILLIVEFLILLPATVYHDSSGLFSSFSILYEILPIDTILIITLVVVLINGAINNLPWVFEAILFRKYHKGYFAIVTGISVLLYLSWVFVVLIFYVFFGALTTLNVANKYMQTFDSSLIEEISKNAQSYMGSLSFALPFVLAYLIIWLVIGIMFYLLYRYRPVDFKDF